jgi:hypothetical protein
MSSRRSARRDRAGLVHRPPRIRGADAPEPAPRIRRNPERMAALAERRRASTASQETEPESL